MLAAATGFVSYLEVFLGWTVGFTSPGVSDSDDFNTGF